MTESAESLTGRADCVGRSTLRATRTRCALFQPRIARSNPRRSTHVPTKHAYRLLGQAPTFEKNCARARCRCGKRAFPERGQKALIYSCRAAPKLSDMNRGAYGISPFKCSSRMRANGAFPLKVCSSVKGRDASWRESSCKNHSRLKECTG